MPPLQFLPADFVVHPQNNDVPMPIPHPTLREAIEDLNASVDNWQPKPMEPNIWALETLEDRE